MWNNDSSIRAILRRIKHHFPVNSEQATNKKNFKFQWKILIFFSFGNVSFSFRIANRKRETIIIIINCDLVHYQHGINTTKLNNMFEKIYCGLTISMFNAQTYFYIACENKETRQTISIPLFMLFKHILDLNFKKLRFYASMVCLVFSFSLLRICFRNKNSGWSCVPKTITTV